MLTNLHGGNWPFILCAIYCIFFRVDMVNAINTLDAFCGAK